MRLGELLKAGREDMDEANRAKLLHRWMKRLAQLRRVRSLTNVYRDTLIWDTYAWCRLAKS
jgi:hypothetical protein